MQADPRCPSLRASWRIHVSTPPARFGHVSAFERAKTVLLRRPEFSHPSSSSQSTFPLIRGKNAEKILLLLPFFLRKKFLDLRKEQIAICTCFVTKMNAGSDDRILIENLMCLREDGNYYIR